MSKLLRTITLIFLCSCAGITTLDKVDRTKLYNVQFLEKVTLINELISSRDLAAAESELMSMDEGSLSSNEISLKRYLLGRFYLESKDTEKAAFNFELALSGAGEDRVLVSQSYLGLAIGYYRLGIYDRSLENLTKLNNDDLSASEKLNSYNIGYQISKAYQNQELYEQSLTGLVSMLGESDFEKEPYYQELYSLLLGKSLDDQKELSLNYIGLEKLPMVKLAMTVAENLIYSGKSEDANNILEQVSNSQFNDSFSNLIAQLRGKLTGDKKVAPLKIGVILPLTGKYKKYGVEALNGIQVAYEKHLREKKYQLSIKDSKSSPIVSSFQANELFEKEKVGLIIGGLSSGEAKATYMELKNKQVLFISLAQVFLPRSEKGPYLIELPPSLESEVSALTDNSNLEIMGKNGAIIFPLDEAGTYYYNEISSKMSDEFNLINAVNYDPKVKDFRDPVKSLLNLKHTKLRQHEFNLMKAYFDSDENSAVRRVQILAPEIDFDWVFIPSRPVEALQLVPSFNYYDAFNTLMIGPASWNGEKIRSLGRKNRKLHFMGEANPEKDIELLNAYRSYFGRNSNLISQRAMMTIGVANEVIPETVTFDRVEYLRGLFLGVRISYNENHWDLVNNIWIKKMSIYHLSRGKPREGIKN